MEDPSLVQILSKLSRMETDLPEIKKELVDLKIRLLDPDAGLYTRVKDLRVWSSSVGEEFNRLQEQIDENKESFDKKEKSFEELISKFEKRMEPIAEYEARILKRRKWVEKIVWVIIPVIIAGFAKGVVSVIDIQDMLKRQQNKSLPQVESIESLEEN